MSNILEEINKAQNIGITGHIRPDGDCIGACTALLNYIYDNYANKTVKVHLENVPMYFEYLPGSNVIDTQFVDCDKYDLFICLDSGDLERIGDSKKYFDNADMRIVIDHHVSNIGYADENLVVADASSTCEVLFELMEYDKISLNTATCLYTGMIHDTGVFKHSNTSEKTMTIAGKLISKGVEFSKIIDESFYQKTYLQNRLLGKCLLNSVITLDGRCILSVADSAVMDYFGAVSSDLEGVIDQLRITKGVEVAVLLHETAKESYKISMRSNSDVDVSKIAIHFGGGGHVKAAGCNMNGKLNAIMESITEQINIQFDK